MKQEDNYFRDLGSEATRSEKVAIFVGDNNTRGRGHVGALERIKSQGWAELERDQIVILLLII